MAPGWFAPPGPHAMRPQQAQQPGGGRFHPSQRMPPGGGGGAGMTGGGVNSPHTHSYHQRSSPPMRGPYHGGPRPHAPPPPPHGVAGHAPHTAGGPRGMPQGSGRFPPQMQHPPQPMVAVVGPRPLPPPNSHSHSHGGQLQAGHSHSHSQMSRHHAPSPGMPRRQIPHPNAMRPIPQQGRPPSLQQQGPPPPHGMHQHQHMMRMQPDHPHQHMHQQRPAFHPHHPHPSSTSQGENVNHQTIQRQTSSGGDSHSENTSHQHQHSYHPPPPAPGTPEQRPAHNHDTHSRSPSPPPIPPPPSSYQEGGQHDDLAEGSSLRPSPASFHDHSETSSVGAEHVSERYPPHHHHPPPPPLGKTPSWNAGPGMGPLRESRLQNMPQKRMMVPMQQHPHPHHHHHHHHVHPHAQRPMLQHHPNSMGTNAYLNENMERFRAMELSKHGGPLHPHHHGMKPIHHPMAQHPPPPIMHRARPLVPSPGQPVHHQQVLQQQQQQQQQKPESKKGPDITMDAASMLLALRTSASPSTVSAATLEEQASRDHSEGPKKTSSQDHDDLEDDDVPALASSSSSLSAPPQQKPAMHHHEVPKNFPTRLALPNDEAKLNSLHCFLRSELLEIFVVERSANKSPTHSPGSSVGRVGLRCVFCAMVRKRHAMSTTAEHDTGGSTQQPRPDEAPMAVFYPKSIAEIYRLVTSWQRCHLRKCRNLPPDIRSKWTLLRENDKSRGKTHYWITSAKEIGLIDCNSRAGGIRFATPRSNSVASGSITTAVSGLADNDSVVSEGLSYATSNYAHESEGVQNTNKKDNSVPAYQPHNNPNFTEGPSQKHREAVAARDVTVSSTALSTVESPLKKESGEDHIKMESGEEPSKMPMEVSVESANATSVVDDSKVGSSSSAPAVTTVSSTDGVPSPDTQPSRSTDSVPSPDTQPSNEGATVVGDGADKSSAQPSDNAPAVANGADLSAVSA